MSKPVPPAEYGRLGEWLDTNMYRLEGMTEDEREVFIGEALGYRNSRGQLRFPYSAVKATMAVKGLTEPALRPRGNRNPIDQRKLSRLALLVLKMAREIGSESLIQDAEAITRLGE